MLLPAADTKLDPRVLPKSARSPNGGLFARMTLATRLAIAMTQLRHPLQPASVVQHELLLAVGKRTGLPVLYNTSFNLFNDPIVCSPRDAVRSFYSSGIDSMFVGPFLLEK